MFITFEGINGSGKSTQARRLYDFLNNQGKDVILTKEPGGGGDVCIAIRELLLKTKDISNFAELFLLYASRVEHINKVILPALQIGKIVICDRYIDSSFAYQCCYNKDMYKIVDFLHNSIGGLMPDITFFIDIPVEVSEERLAPLVYEAKVKGEGYKKYDELKTEHMEKIISIYKELADKNKDRIITINGTNDPDKVENDIRDLLLKRTAL